MQGAMHMGMQAAHDPKKFFGDMLGNAIDLKDFQTGHTERGIGYNVPAVFLALATGGEGVAVKASGESFGTALIRSMFGRELSETGGNFVFRGGSDTLRNLTPRWDQDLAKEGQVPGLSTFRTIEQALGDRP
jgi:hypothetical protein